MRREINRAALALAGLALALGVEPALADVAVEVVQPRPFGYVVGDVVRQRLLVHAPGYALNADALPQRARASTWLERTRVEAARTADGWRVDLEYQFVNAPRELRTVSLPAVSLALRAGDAAVAASVDEWPVTLGPITPESVLARAGLEEMRPDLPPPTVDTTWTERRLAFYALAATLIAAFWALAHFGWSWRGRAPRPFARAAREFRARAASRDPDDHRAALRALHRAFDAAAGGTLFAPGIAGFVAAHPRFAPVRAQVEAFYALSQRAFFAGAGVPVDETELAQVRALAARLVQIERTAD